jgi:hypothetical protein
MKSIGERGEIMRRLPVLIVSVLGFVGLLASHGAVHAQPEKQLVCHVAGTSGAHIIEVSVNAVPAHLQNHGDCLIDSTDRTLIGEPCNPTDANGNDICDVQP